MSALRIVFGILASLVGLYNFLCLIRIALTWIPNVSSSKVSQFLAKICDPYLNIFRGIRGLRLGSFDFSPAIGLLLLALAANVLDSLPASIGAISWIALTKLSRRCLRRR